MVRYDLAFFLCCCKSFLGSTGEEGAESFYELLGIDNDATPEEIKKAYKRRSLEMHPDKLAQRGKVVTPEDQARFTRMKEAYEVRTGVTQCVVTYLCACLFNCCIRFEIAPLLHVSTTPL